LIWGINGHISEITLEVTYKLTGNTIKADYVYTSRRTDNQIVSQPVNIVGQAVPAIYLNKFFTQIESYEGSAPWTNGATQVKTIASNQINTASNFTLNEPTEGWTAIISPSQSLALGVYNSISNYVRSERKNLVNENLANDLDDACTIVEVLHSPNLPDSHNVWSRTDNVYFILDTVAQIRAKAYQIAGH
jgi:hypothetical protein